MGPTLEQKQDHYTFYPKDENGNIIKNDIPISATCATMEALLTTGKVRSIGISNFFTPEKIEELLST
jgi:diketogulonate reductase-like aldo/keto reductase